MQNVFTPSPKAQLCAMINGFQLTQMLYVITRLEIPELLGDKTKDVEELALSANVKANPLFRLLRTLETVGIFENNENNGFMLTPMGKMLKKDHPESLRPFVLGAGAGYIWEAYGNLLKNIQTGEPGFIHAHGTDWVSYFSNDIKSSKIFNDHMAALCKFETQAILESYDFSKFHAVVDIGGGIAIMLEAIVNKYPHINAVLYDTETVVNQAMERIKNSSLENRFKFISGDFLRSVPKEGDLYLLMNVFHDWPDEQALQLLKNCKSAMDTNSVLLIITRVAEKDEYFSANVFLDIMLMIVTGGKIRTLDEHGKMCQEAEMKIRNVIKTSGAYFILEVIPQ